MSNRTLIEVNHDFCHALDHPEFLRDLRLYLTSASRETAGALERYGLKVIGMRNHSCNFILDGDPDGFPVQYLTRAKA